LAKNMTFVMVFRPEDQIAIVGCTLESHPDEQLGNH
jgi:hypothetical protein